MSTTKRAEHITDNTQVAGCYILTDFDHVRKVLLPRRAQKDDADPKTAVLFATSSNAATSPSFELAPSTCVQSVLCLAKAEDVPPAFKTGIKFKKTHKDLGKHCKDDDTNYVFVLVPCCLPIPYGSVGVSGKLDENMAAAMDIVSPTYGKVWLALMESHDPALQQTIEAEVLGKPTRHIPNIENGEFLNPTAKITPEGVGPSLEPKFENHMVAMGAQLATIVSANLADVAAAAAATAIANANAALTAAPPIAVLKVPKVGFAPPSGDDDDDDTFTTKNSNAAKITVTDIQHGKISIVGGRWHLSTGFVTPIPTDTGEILRSTTKNSERLQIVTNGFISRFKRMKKSKGYVERTTDMPTQDATSAGYFATGNFSAEPLYSLEDATNKHGFVLAMLLPVCCKTSKQKRKLNVDREAQEAVGEHGDRLVALNTSINTATSINSLKAGISLCSNIVCAFSTLEKAQPKMDDDLDTYFGIVAAAYQLADDLSSHRVTKF